MEFILSLSKQVVSFYSQNRCLLYTLQADVGFFIFSYIDAVSQDSPSRFKVHALHADVWFTLFSADVGIIKFTYVS